MFGTLMTNNACYHLFFATAVFIYFFIGPQAYRKHK